MITLAGDVIELISRLENMAEFFRTNFKHTNNTPTFRFHACVNQSQIEMPCSANITETDLAFRKMHFDLFRWASRATEIAKQINEEDYCYITCDKWIYIHFGTRTYNLLGDYMFEHNIGQEDIWESKNGNKHRTLHYNSIVTVMEELEEANEE